ncbi:MAG: FtsW/RodA/SpoVE family cell cycle protein [Saprospiraceae bacterium]
MSSIIARLNAELRGDKAIWGVLVLLALFSLLAVYSSTGTLAYKYYGGDTEVYLIKHGMILMGGIFLAYICHLFDYMTFNRLAPILLLIAIPMLVYTLGFGVEVNDAKRWLEVPFIGLTFQTSDFAKVALILYIARVISSKQDYIKDFKGAFLPIIVPVMIICGLIAPADLSGAAVLFMTAILMMFVGRVSIPFIVLLLLLGVVGFAVLIILGDVFPEIRSDTWQSRIEEFRTEGGGYQAQQSKIAIANGGWIGLGPGNSIQKNYLPYAHADFIYAIICEEYGLIGGGMVIGLFVLFFFRITRIVTKSPKAFGAMAAIGLGMSLLIHAFMNIGVSVNVIPVTGLNLPIISKGGTSILFTCISFGIILSVSKFVETISYSE